MAKLVSDDVAFEASLNERSKDDTVYLFLESLDADQGIETYLSVEDFRGILRCMLEVERQLENEDV